MSRETAFYDSPIGVIKLEAEGNNITYLGFIDTAEAGGYADSVVISGCMRQLDEYFAGNRKSFDLGIELKGTEFRKRVWAELLQIPYGETRSYKALADAAGNARASRAAGGANHNNPVSIIVPCHRVIGADGKLTGYGGGLWRKEWLLNHEKRFV